MNLPTSIYHSENNGVTSYFTSLTIFDKEIQRKVFYIFNWYLTIPFFILRIVSNNTYNTDYLTETQDELQLYLLTPFFFQFQAMNTLSAVAVSLSYFHKTLCRHFQIRIIIRLSTYTTITIDHNTSYKTIS